MVGPSGLEPESAGYEPVVTSPGYMVYGLARRMLTGCYDPENAYLSYNNPAVFDLINKAKVTSGQDQRAKMYAQAEEMIMADYRDVLIAHAKLPLLMQKNVDGLVAQPSSIEYMETVELK